MLRYKHIACFVNFLTTHNLVLLRLLWGRLRKLLSCVLWRRSELLKMQTASYFETLISTYVPDYIIIYPEHYVLHLYDCVISNVKWDISETGGDFATTSKLSVFIVPHFTGSDARGGSCVHINLNCCEMLCIEHFKFYNNGL